MFENAFSFDGRIRRTEYLISLVIYAFAVTVVNFIAIADASFVLFFNIPALWFICAQGTKRCHDVGNNGWWQLVPLYGFLLLFQDGVKGKNQYGYNPKWKSAFY